MATKRTGISKKIRFEVFKRDSFTCQYCGRSAPDVILEIDHISPVARGGNNDVMNLVTACKDCNSGKGAKELTDNQIIKQQQQQLEELNERRNQMLMMVEWRKELSRIDEEQANIINTIFHERTGSGFNNVGCKDVKKWIRKYGMQNVVEATDRALNSYYIEDNDDETWGKAFEYVGRIAMVLHARETNPIAGRDSYIFGIIKNRFNVYNEQRTMTLIRAVCRDKASADKLQEIAKRADSWNELIRSIEEKWEVFY